jgi:hypothetical protein
LRACSLNETSRRFLGVRTGSRPELLRQAVVAQEALRVYGEHVLPELRG